MPSITWEIPVCLSEALFEKWLNEVVALIKTHGLEWRDDHVRRERERHEVSVIFAFYENEPDGQVQPFVEAISNALSKMLPKYLHAVRCSGSKVVKAEKYAHKLSGVAAVPNDPAPEEFKTEYNENLFRNMDEFEFSVRAYNCLKTANIRTIADLVQKTESELLKTKGFGKRSLNEIKTILGEMGLQLGVRIDPEEFERMRTKYERSSE